MNDLSHQFPLPAHRDGVDFIEAGAGPLVVLVHSSMSGARQWSALSRDLENRFLVRAVNLFGYGNTPAWANAMPPTLDDFAELVALAAAGTEGGIRLVGHSFGAAVAMRAAALQLRGRVERLVLIEPSEFQLLARSGRREAFREISVLADHTRRWIALGMLEEAAERFIDYWCGAGSWAANPPARKTAIAQLIALLPHEWDAAFAGNTTSAECTAALPSNTLLLSSTGTTLPSRTLVELLLEARPDWAFASICAGGHMSPVTHPHLVNPIIGSFLTDLPSASALGLS